MGFINNFREKKRINQICELSGISKKEINKDRAIQVAYYLFDNLKIQYTIKDGGEKLKVYLEEMLDKACEEYSLTGKMGIDELMKNPEKAFMDSPKKDEYVLEFEKALKEYIKNKTTNFWKHAEESNAVLSAASSEEVLLVVDFPSAKLKELRLKNFLNRKDVQEYLKKD